MADTQTKLEWDAGASRKYKEMTEKIPLFHREIAKKVVDKKAEELALERNSNVIEESDIVRAFFAEVPHAFYSLMIRLFDEVGFDYKEYESK